MHICFVLEYYYPHVGGAEILFQHLAEGLVKAGHACDVVTCRLPGTRAEEEINGVQVHRVPVPRIGDRYWFTVLALAASWKYAREADVIHTMVYNGAFPARFVALLRKKPVIVHVFEVIGSKWHLLGIPPLLAMVYRLLEKIVLAIPFDAYSCISLSTKAALRNAGISESRLFLAYPGIDYTLFDPGRKGLSRDEVRRRLGVSEDRFLYTFYGRPGFVKGVQQLTAAVPLIKERLTRSTLLLILSRKPESGRLRVAQEARDLRLVPGEDIIIIDPVPRQELPSYIAASDCVVVPSLSEGFGFTCVEACAMQRPVVATTAGSLPEVVSGQYVLVEPGSAEALAEGVVRISRNEYQRSEEKRFLWEDHVKRHEEKYRELISDRLPR
jgi:D-inositol-3-phosphate glycosyltransferase